MTAKPVITAITEALGAVTLTVTQADSAPVDVYSRAAGTSVWTLSAEAQAVGDIAIEGLTAGTTYEFYAVAIDDEVSSAPSNLMYIYLHNSDLPTVAECEAWAVGVLSGLGVFDTVAVWKHQIVADKGGLEVMDKLSPFAFVGEIPAPPAREGGYALDRKIRLRILIGQKSMTDGTARTGDADTIGTIELRSLVIAALDGQHPGGSIGCDDFYYRGCEEVVNFVRKHAVEIEFEAKWMA